MMVFKLISGKWLIIFVLIIAIIFILLPLFKQKRYQEEVVNIEQELNKARDSIISLNSEKISLSDRINNLNDSISILYYQTSALQRENKYLKNAQSEKVRKVSNYTTDSLILFMREYYSSKGISLTN